jgi:dGTPase
MSAAKLQGAERAVVVADYIAGMTDRYALGEVKRVSRTTSCPVSNQLF